MHFLGRTARSSLARGIFVLTAYCLLLNLPYMHLREFQGEEGKRVVIAQNMLKTGEFAVPQVEGTVYLNKPPLFNWYLAGLFKLSGRITEASARMASVLAALLGALVLSLFWRKVINGKGLSFILPGLVFLSLPDVMDKAIRAEIDMTFAFIVISSLLLWFYLHEVKRKEFPAWLASLSIVSAGALTKGVQAPAFFYAAVLPFLAYKKEWKKIFSLAHLSGILLGLSIFSLWLVPVLNKVGLNDFIRIWGSEITQRGAPLKENSGFLKHLVEFPADFVTQYLPWLPFSFLWFGNRSSQKPGPLKDLAVYCLFCVLFSFPAYWLLPGARLRYILPLSGALALLLSMPLEKLIQNEMKEPRWASIYVKAFAVLPLGLILSLPFWGKRFGAFDSSLPILFLSMTALCSLLLLREYKIKRKIGLLVIVILFLKLSWASIYFPYYSAHSSYYRKAAKIINSIVPEEARLYDLDVGNQHITYYLARDVKMIGSRDLAQIEPGSYIFSDREKMDRFPQKNLSLLATIQARRKQLLLYKVEAEPGKTEVAREPLQNPPD